MLKLKYLRSGWIIGKNWFIIKLSTVMKPGPFKNWWLRRTGAKIARSAWISPDVIIDPVFPELIRIHEEVFIGWGTKIFTHQINPDMNWNKEWVVIHWGAFVGGDCTIRCGTSIGEKAIIASNTLVSKVVPAGTMAIGIPMQIRELK